MNKHLLALPLLILLPTYSAQADPDAGLDQLLSLSMNDLMSLKIRISTNTAQTLARAPSVVSVITADDIRATGATNLTEILQSVPGIYIRANLFGFRPQVTFRGAAGTHALLMVNGAPIKDLMWSSGIFWKGLPTSMIERVEIIRGPGSALFGSDASAGVINVITRTAGQIEQSEAGIRAGSFATQAGWIHHGGQWNGFDIGFSADLSTTYGHAPYIAADGQTIQDAKEGTQLSQAPGQAHYGWQGQDLRFSIARDHWRLQADYMGHSDLEIGLTGAAVLDPTTRASDNRYNLGLFYNNEAYARDWGVNAELRYYHLDYTSGSGFQERPPGYVCSGANCNGIAPGIYPDGLLNQIRSAERGFNLEASGLYTGIRKHALRIGGGYSSNDLYFVEQFVNFGIGPDGNLLPAGSPLVNISDTAQAITPEQIRQIRYLFMQDIWTIADDWELTAGARYDHYSDFGGSLNPRLALVWQTSKDLTTKLMYGQAFRAPSFLELYANTAANNPNPDLTPELSNTWDLSFCYSATENLKLGLDIYQFEQSNLIAADATRTFRNLGNRTSRGLELEAQWQADKKLRIAGNISIIDEDDATFPDSLPKSKAYLRTDWAFAPHWNWNIQANWIGKRTMSSTNGRSPLDAYKLVDTTLRYSPHPDWALTTSIRNLFDVDAREYSSPSIPGNLPLPGRSFSAELIWKF